MVISLKTTWRSVSGTRGSEDPEHATSGPAPERRCVYPDFILGEVVYTGDPDQSSLSGALQPYRKRLSPPYPPVWQQWFLAGTDLVRFSRLALRVQTLTRGSPPYAGWSQFGYTVVALYRLIASDLIEILTEATMPGGHVSNNRYQMMIRRWWMMNLS